MRVEENKCGECGGIKQIVLACYCDFSFLVIVVAFFFFYSCCFLLKLTAAY